MAPSGINSCESGLKIGYNASTFQYMVVWWIAGTVSLRQHGFFVQPTKQQINLLTGYFPSGIADLGTGALGDSGPWG